MKCLDRKSNVFSERKCSGWDELWGITKLRAALFNRRKTRVSRRSIRPTIPRERMTRIHLVKPCVFEKFWYKYSRYVFCRDSFTTMGDYEEITYFIKGKSIFSFTALMFWWKYFKIWNVLRQWWILSLKMFKD